MANQITFTSAPFNQITQFTSAGGTAVSTVLTADATNDRRIYGITVWTDEGTSAKDLQIHITDGTTVWEMTTLSIPINSGNTNALVPVDVFAHTQMAPYLKNRDASGSLYFNLPKTWSLRVNFNTALSSGKVANVMVIGETYA